MMNVDEGKENRHVQKRAASRQSKEESCGRCGKTPKTKTESKSHHHDNNNKADTMVTPTPEGKKREPLSISLIRPGKTSAKKGKRKRCKHKEELAKYTNVSVATTTTCSNYSTSVAGSVLDEGGVSDSEQSCVTSLTQLTQRSDRSIKRERDANKEIARLNNINNHLTEQLDLLSSRGSNLQEMIDKLTTPQKPHRPLDDATLDDNTLTPGGDPVNISMTTQQPSPPPHVAMTTHLPAPPSRTPSTPRQKISPQSSRGFTPHKDTFLEPVREYVTKTPGGQSERSVTAADSAYHTEAATLRASRELLTELEEENAELRAELKGSISSSKRMLALEKQLREMSAENYECKQEIARLEGVGVKLRQVEEFYHEEKKAFRCTIEDTLITLEDFRRDKEDLEREIDDLNEKLKDAAEKSSNTKEELEERNSLLSNNVEKLKLELETGSAENAMLQSRVTTVEENCCFLEGQVKALEKDSVEKTQIIVAAEQHARDLETEIGEIRRDKMALETENQKIAQLSGQIEALEGTIKNLEGDKTDLKSQISNMEREKETMESRLSELVKSHTKLEETLEEKNRDIVSLKSDVDTVKRDAHVLSTNYRQADEEKTKLGEESAEKSGQIKSLSDQVAKLQSEIKFIEESFFKGWSEDDSSSPSVSFEDERATSPPQFPQANKIIQTIKLDRQKLKAKLVRSVQDGRTLQSKLNELQDRLEVDSTSFSRKLGDALDRLSESDIRTQVLERKAKNLALQVEELSVVNQSLEQENYHLKKLSDTLTS